MVDVRLCPARGCELHGESRARDYNARMNDKSDPKRFIGMGLGIGIAIGTGIGVAMGNIAMGIGPGIAIGLGLGVALSRKAAAANLQKEQ